MKRKTLKHLPRCVYFKHSAYWHVKGGRWVRLGETLPAALAAYSAIVEPRAGSMPALIDKAMPSICKAVKPATAKSYRVAGNKLKRMLVEFNPDQVQGKHVAKIVADLEHMPNMANRCLSVLRLVFKYAVKFQMVGNNPCIGIDRLTESKRTRLILPGEYEAICEHAEPMLRAVMDLLRSTGQRLSDVLAIRHADLTDDGIRFKQMKTGSKVTIRWTPDMRAAVERAKALNGNIRALTILHRRGRPLDDQAVRRRWDKACAAAGVLDAHLHDLRAVTLTEAKRQGIDATALAGHSSAAQTVRYLRDREEPLVDAPTFRQSIDSGNK